MAEGLLGGADAGEEAGAGAASKDVPAAPPALPNKDAGDAAWYWNEGIAGAGSPPEWFRGDKYKTVAEQAAAYPELEKKIGQKLPPPEDGPKAPDKYEINIPDGIDWPIDAADPMLADMTAAFKEMDLSQEQFDVILTKYAHWNGAANQVSREEELKALGTQGPKIIEEVSSWGSRNLPAEDWQTMQGLATTASALKLFHALTRAASTAQNVPGSLEGTAGDQAAAAQLSAVIGTRGYGAAEEARALELAAKLAKDVDPGT